MNNEAIGELQEWGKKLSALALRHPWLRPGLPAIPDLFIFAAKPKEEAVSASLGDICGKQSAETVVIYMLWGADEETVRRNEAQNERVNVLFCAASEGDTAFVDKILHAIYVLKPGSVKFAASPNHPLPLPLRMHILSAIELAHINNKTSRASRLLWMRCFLRNLPSILSETRLTLPSVAPGTAAIVCAAGPSLNSQFELIRKNRSKALLISVGHAAGRLAKAGLTPDLVVELDASAHVHYPDRQKFDCPLATIATVSPQVPALYKGVIWGQGASRETRRLLERLGLELPLWNLSRSVTITTLDIAARMGCNPIGLVGSDLALAADGARYVGEDASTPDDTESIDGLDGSTVSATQNFIQLRKTLESWLAALPGNYPELEIFNCTGRGAQIEHSKRKALEDFYRDVKKNAAPLRLEAEKPLVHETAGSLHKLESALTSYHETLKSLVKASDQLLKEICSDKAEIETIRKIQTQLRTASEEEAKATVSDPLADLLRPLNEQMAEWKRERPQHPVEDSNLPGQLNELIEEKKLLADICADILSDLKPGPETKNQYLFNSLRQCSLRIIARNNTAFACFLSKTKAADDGDGHFQFSPVFHDLPPYVCRLTAKGKEPLSAYETMATRAGREISAFENEIQYSSTRHSLIFLAPGNWVHPLVFAKRHPDASMLIADPWPELLAALIERGLFLHYLPQKTLITGLGDCFPEGKEQCREQIETWTTEGREILFFPHPCTWKIPEIKKVVEEFRSSFRKDKMRNAANAKTGF